jgi:murein DD-endopeptidase MepM/ murein hydrolase activator NlpD
MAGLRRRGILVLIGLAPSVLCGQTQVLRFPGGAEVEIRAPVLEPGRIVLARLVQGPDLRKITLRFGSVVYELEPGEETAEPFVLIGLDLGLKPGAHELVVTAYLRDGRVEELRHWFQVGARDFPVRKLWVKEEFVRPPPEVQDRIRREAEILEIVYSVGPGAWLGEGAFELPHPAAETPNFGEKRIYNNVPRSTHSGVDIAAPYGSPVRASNSGRVVLARDLYFSGKTVIIDHGLGLFTFYCHFSRLKVTRGEAVKKGAVIALAGSTGRSTGPHLHWGVRLRGSRVDPNSLLSLPLPD